jgi:hypothetical protein
MSVTTCLCGVKFTDSTLYDRHRVKVHGIQGTTCTCGAYFTSRDLYDRHMEYVHKNDPSECGLCQKTFANTTALWLHDCWVKSMSERKEQDLREAQEAIDAADAIQAAIKANYEEARGAIKDCVVRGKYDHIEEESDIDL